MESFKARDDITKNKRDEYIIFRKNAADDFLSGKYDTGLTFMQRAYYIQTGASVPLLGGHMDELD
jgi:hypothetical protein